MKRDSESGEEGRSATVPTISQVAKVSGVSRATVSRAFSRPEMLTEETVRRVKEVADKLGYVPNQVARALSTGRHGRSHRLSSRSIRRR